MTAIDPFNHGSTETLNSHVVADESRAAALAIMRRFAGTPDLADMLAALGLTDTANDMLLRRRQDRGELICTPEPPKLFVVPSAARSGPTIRRPDLPANQQGPPQWAIEKFHKNRTATAIANAQRVIAEMHAAPEAAPVDEWGASIPRCTRRIHHKRGTNVRLRTNGRLACVACEKILAAQQLLRHHGVKP